MRCLRQYIKKVRELHRKLEHYEHGGGDSLHGGGLALRDMEGVLAQRDASVLGQTRKLMSTQQRLVDALGCAHHALWQSENHLTLTHVESPPSELMATTNVWEQNMRWLVRALQALVEPESSSSTITAAPLGWGMESAGPSYRKESYQ
eukprot:COSAG01_NODE_493_length_16327_cov_5.632879_7_plen_148_part_00